jgi:hypothetical protein
VDYVEFDIEPFGQNPGLPYVDPEPPFEWLCNISMMNVASSTPDESQPLGVNKMIRARVYDESGQVWTDEHWVYINNMESFGKRFLIGFLKNRVISDTEISFTTRCIFSLTLDTFIPALYISNEQFIVSQNNKFGYIGPLGIIGFFDVQLVDS